MKLSLTLFFVLVAVLSLTVTSFATPFVPPGMSPGSSYHLAFITSGTRDATSTAIADYNTFVNAQAANNPSVTGTGVGVHYFVIGSTATVDASTNAPVSAPVYNMAGQLVATGSADLWDGTLANAINRDEFGSPLNWEVWSGTTSAGLAGSGTELGSASPLSGLSSMTTADWIDRVGQTPPANFPLSFYALSEELTAPGIPEPSAFLILSTAGMAVFLRRTRWLRI